MVLEGTINFFNFGSLKKNSYRKSSFGQLFLEKSSANDELQIKRGLCIK